MTVLSQNYTRPHLGMHVHCIPTVQDLQAVAHTSINKLDTCYSVNYMNHICINGLMLPNMHKSRVLLGQRTILHLANTDSNALHRIANIYIFA